MATPPRTYDLIEGELPENDDPRHVEADGSSSVGAIDLKATVNANVAQEVDASWRDNERAREHRNRFSSNQPHIRAPYSPLETLVLQSLRRYGDMHPGTVDGEVMMMFIEFANLVIEDLRGHPYWDNPEIDYYIHASEWRAIPDNIIVSGLLYHYSVQQQSNKIEAYGPMYFKMMNRVLYQRKYGSGKIEMSPFDKSQLPSGSQPYDARRT
mgnify:CR=1 FL=1|jgi:hypothetical protein